MNSTVKTIRELKTLSSPHLGSPYYVESKWIPVEEKEALEKRIKQLEFEAMLSPSFFRAKCKVLETHLIEANKILDSILPAFWGSAEPHIKALRERLKKELG